jgi:hypothetical protein
MNTTHADNLGRVAEDLAIVKLSTRFENCIVSHVVNNQLHDVEIRKKDELLTKGICRIQVKSTNSKQRDGASEYYGLSIHHGVGGTASYKQGDVDFFLFFVFPEAKYYVVPAHVVGDRNRVKLYFGLSKPKRSGSAICEKYLEAWDLIGDFLGLSKIEGESTDNTLTRYM